jgi:hypothetical protein
LNLPAEALINSGNGYTLASDYSYLPSGRPGKFKEDVVLDLPPAHMPSDPGSASTIDVSGIQEDESRVITPPSADAVVKLNSDGNVTLSGNRTLVLNPGQYWLSGLDLSGGATLRIAPDLEGRPVVLYLNGTSAAQALFDNAGSASALQIYSDSSGTIALRGKDNVLRSMVYAPNASISLDAQTARGAGTFVGRTVNFGNDTNQIAYDESLGKEKTPIPPSVRNAIIRNWGRR